MDIYIYLLVLLLVLLFFTTINKKLLILPFVVITFFSGFRYNVGIDYKTYELLYEWSEDGSQVTSEPFFSYFIQFCYALGGNVQLFFLLSAIITNWFVFLFIKKVSSNYVLSFLLYFCVISFYLYTFNATRQWLACSVFLYSLVFFKDKKYTVYIIINLIAALTFHMSLLFIFPLTFLTTLNLSKNVRLMGYPFAIVIGLFSSFFLSASLYGNYQETDFDSSVDLKVYIFLLMSIFIEINKKKFISKNNRWSMILVNINYLSILLLIMMILQSSGTMVLLFKRFHNYYFALYIVMIPYFLSNWNNIKGSERLINLCFYILLPILFLVTIYSSGEFNELIPYYYNFNVFNN